MTLCQYYDQEIRKKHRISWNTFCAEQPKNVIENYKKTLKRQYKILKKMEK